MRQCTFDGCDKPHEARGLCTGHYQQSKAGAPLTPLRRYRFHEGSVEARFWECVEKTDTCWTWMARTDAHGYGRFHISRNEFVAAHRFAWELLNGAIPTGFVIDHDHPEYGCHNPSCVNPAHLQPVERSVNAQRRKRKVQANNTSGERGVHFDISKKRWRAQITFTENGQRVKLRKTSKDRAVVSAWVIEMREKYHQ